MQPLSPRLVATIGTEMVSGSIPGRQGGELEKEALLGQNLWHTSFDPEQPALFLGSYSAFFLLSALKVKCKQLCKEAEAQDLNRRDREEEKGVLGRLGLVL